MIYYRTAAIFSLRKRRFFPFSPLIFIDSKGGSNRDQIRAFNSDCSVIVQ
jgi:MinD-like ATPase involved in chromosome partitioning or flagellar assembly